MDIGFYSRNRLPYPFELYELGYERSPGLGRVYRKRVDQEEASRAIVEAFGIPVETLRTSGISVPRNVWFFISYEWPAEIHVNGDHGPSATISLNRVERGSQVKSAEKRVLRRWARNFADRHADFILRYTNNLRDLYGELTSESVKRLVSTT